MISPFLIPFVKTWCTLGCARIQLYVWADEFERQLKVAEKERDQ